MNPLSLKNIQKSKYEKNIVGTIEYKGDDEATIVSWLRFFLEKMDKKVALSRIPLSLKIYFLEEF